MQLGEKDKFPPKVEKLLYINRGLKTDETRYIYNKMKKEALKLFVSMRYGPDPNRYDAMTKRELIKELRHRRYY